MSSERARGSPVSRRGGWQPAGVDVEHLRREAARPYTSRRSQRPDPGPGARVVVGLAVVVAVAVLVARWDVAPPDRREVGAIGGATPATVATAPGAPRAKTVLAFDEVVPYSQLPAYAGVAWADALQRAQGSGRPNPYFNVENGDRRTLAPPSCDCPRVRVWFSGGSAAFGIGQRDGHTVASELVRLAARRGIALEMTNVSRDGAVFVEEVANIERRLESEPAPDLVIVFNGWNDNLLAVAERFRREHGDGGEDYSTFTGYLQNINHHPEEFVASAFGVEAGRETAQRYRDLQRKLDGIVASHGGETAYYFQPDALTSARQLTGYEQLSGLSAAELMASPLAVAGEAATASLGSSVHDLRHLFDDDPTNVFLGLVHQNEAGAAAVARRIFDTEWPRLFASAR